MFFFFDRAEEDRHSVASRYFRIHGDNIVECERTLELIRDAYSGVLTLQESPLYKPKYLLSFDSGCYVIELLSGHNRWGVDVVSVMQENGGIIHEGADSYVTELIGEEEYVIFALEYCSALPAGNNAWQRSGRALSSVMAGVPYLYFTEIGGVELDEERNVKAPRFPNPVVPFSYVSTSERYKCCCIPVYKPHPSITQETYDKYEKIIGIKQSLEIVKGLMEKEDISQQLEILTRKNIELVKLLSESRRLNDTLRNEDWTNFLYADNPVQWLVENTADLKWKKKSAGKVRVSESYRQLISFVNDCQYKTIGSKDLPICIVPQDCISQFEDELHMIYPDLEIHFDGSRPLAIAWITGFKPRGDDSRPDRGLVPLARMTIGADVDLMSVVSGPAKAITWQKMESSIDELCAENGLWRAIFKLSNHILIDSATIDKPRFYSQAIAINTNRDALTFPLAKDPREFTEDDTDCAIHQIFAHKENMGILEGMCNPPGGDWSGVSCLGSDIEYRWTSLPRVSRNEGKRPDHVIQIIKDEVDVFFIIESKGIARDLEDNVGQNLAAYLHELFLNMPTAKKNEKGEWRSMEDDIPVLKPRKMISIGAFMYSDSDEMEEHRTRGGLDAVIAFQLGQESIVHVLDRSLDRSVKSVLLQIEQVMAGFEVQVY